MARVEFSVYDKPPKKDGANSMWSKESEFHRIVALRQAALKAMMDCGLNAPFEEFVSLRLDLFIPKAKIASVGDLDNFITGICDGLQAADPRSRLYSSFNRLDNSRIHPMVPLLLTNDALVVEIVALKNSIPESSRMYYTVAIEATPLA